MINFKLKNVFTLAKFAYTKIKKNKIFVILIDFALYAINYIEISIRIIKSCVCY